MKNNYIVGLKKYKGKNTQQLLRMCARRFSRHIRLRDEGKPCVSCGKYRILQCGHFYSAGKYPRLRFNENNSAGQCLQCNYYGSMETGSRYRVELERRIGKDELERLDMIALDRTPFSWNRFDLIEKIEKYK